MVRHLGSHFSCAVRESGLWFYIDDLPVFLHCNIYFTSRLFHLLHSGWNESLYAALAKFMAEGLVIIGNFFFFFYNLTENKDVPIYQLFNCSVEVELPKIWIRKRTLRCCLDFT